jgi:chromosome segregation ATPase
MAPLNEEGVKELNKILSELTINSKTIVVKMDQIYDSIERLESSIEKLEATTEKISTVVGTQEKRITVLESQFPPHLMQDIALLKRSQDTFSKILWIVGTAAIGSLLNAVFKAMN